MSFLLRKSNWFLKNTYITLLVILRVSAETTDSIFAKIHIESQSFQR